MLFGGGTGGEFAEEAEQGSGGFLIGEIFERHRGSEVRGFGVEADANEIFVAPRGQRVHDRAEFDGPVFFGGENDGAGARDVPGASGSGVLLSRMARPAVTDDIEMEAGRKSHVGFERKRFLLLAPATQGPLDGQRPGQQANGKTSVLKPAGGKMEGGFEPRAAGLPAQIRDVALSQACRLQPLQHVTRAAAVVMHKPGIPEEENYECCHDYVDENETAHGAPWKKSYFLSMQPRKWEKQKKGRCPVGAQRQGKQREMENTANPFGT